jgi:hypothetical protein
VVESSLRVRRAILAGMKIYAGLVGDDSSATRQTVVGKILLRHH